MKTATFCQEIESGVTQHQINERVKELKTLGGALDAYSKKIGEKYYIYTVREVYDEPLDDMVTNPDRAGVNEEAAQPAVSGGTISTTKDVAANLLTAVDYDRAAATLGCEVAAIQAVAEIESGGRTGFLPDGRPKILFESHLFSKLTAKKYDTTHSDLSTPTWTRNYVGGAGEHERLERAMLLDREAALKSASWGKFQILGLNYARVGYKTVDDFVDSQKQSEQQHLEAFVKFILSHDLSDELRERRWADFARRYNGAGFAKNHYDEKMANAYSKYNAIA